MPQTVTIDLLSPASFADGQPHEQFRWLREHSPVYRHLEPDGPGFWAVTRYDDVRSVGRDPELFSSAPTILIPDLAGVDFGDHQMMITADPPRHTRFRRIINSQFTPRAAERLRARIEQLAAQIIDAIIERGECDAVTDIAGEMPSFVIADLLGIPLDDGRRLYHLTETIHAAPESVPPGAGMGAIIDMFNYAHQVAEDKRKQPRDDLASRILEAEVDGQRLDDIGFNLFFLLLSRGRRSRPATRSSCTTDRPTVTSAPSPSRTGSTSAANRTSTSRSAAADRTSASAPTSRGSRRKHWCASS